MPWRPSTATVRLNPMWPCDRCSHLLANIRGWTFLRNRAGLRLCAATVRGAPVFAVLQVEQLQHT
jgi:hypothetical protein